MKSPAARPPTLGRTPLVACCAVALGIVCAPASVAVCLAGEVPTYVSSWGNYSGETWGLAADSHGALYVPDTEHRRVDKYDADGKLLLSIGGPDRFYRPYWVVVNSHDEVLVLDHIKRTIQVFDTGGNYLRTFDGYQPGSYLPATFGRDADDNLYIAEFHPSDVDPPVPTSYRLQKYSPSGTHLLNFDLTTCPVGGCMRQDRQGQMYGGSDNDQFVRFSATGACLARIGESGTGPAQFRYPAGLDVLPDGNLVCVDGGNRRVQLLTPEGVFLGEWNTAGPEGEFEYPEGALVVGDAIYITDQSRIHKFILATTPVRAPTWGGLKTLYR